MRKTVLIAFLLVTLNNVALFTHYNYANKVYEKCYLQNIHSTDYEKDLSRCMKRDSLLRILGTILFTEGSYLEEII